MAPPRKVAKREVECEPCNHRFESREAKPKCGKCGSFEVRELKVEQIRKREGGKEIELKAPASVTLSGQEMALAEVMINAGMAKNMSELLKKSLRVTAGMSNLNPLLGGGIMGNLNTEKKEPTSPEQVIKNAQATEATQISLDQMKERLKKGESFDSKELMDMIKTRQAMKMLENMDKEGDSGMKDMFSIMLLQSMTQNKSNNNGDGEVVKAINELKESIKEKSHEEKITALTNTVENKFATMEGKLARPGGEDIKALKEAMIEIEKIREKGRADLEKTKANVNTEIEKRKQVELDHKLKETERKIAEIAGSSQGTGGIKKSDISEIKETISAVKELSKELGGEKKTGKDAGEVVSEIIGKTIENITPIAKTYFEEKSRHPQPNPPPTSAQPPIITEPVQTVNPEANPLPPNPEQPPQPGDPEIPQPPLSPEEEITETMNRQQKAPGSK